MWTRRIRMRLPRWGQPTCSVLGRIPTTLSHCWILGNWSNSDGSSSNLSFVFVMSCLPNSLISLPWINHMHIIYVCILYKLFIVFCCIAHWTAKWDLALNKYSIHINILEVPGNLHSKVKACVMTDWKSIKKFYIG